MNLLHYLDESTAQARRTVTIPAANTAELHTERGNGCLLNISVRIHAVPLPAVKGYGVFFFSHRSKLKNRMGFLE